MKLDRFVTKRQVLQHFKNIKNYDIFCFYCYNKLIKTKEGLFYCPNEMCLNQEHGSIEKNEVV